MTNSFKFTLLEELSAHQTAEIEAFVSRSPSGSYLQMPAWPTVCPTPKHHSYVHLTARNEAGELVAYALARITPLAMGFRLASMRRGPVTTAVDDLHAVCNGFAAQLRKVGCCSLTLNPRWQGPEAVSKAIDVLSKIGAKKSDAANQPLHQATLLVDLSGDIEQLTARLKQRARRQIKKAEKMGLSVRHVETLDEARRFEPVMKDFYKRRQLGMEGIPQIDDLFHMTRERGVFILGEIDEEVVCGHVVVADGDRAFWLVMASSETHDKVPKNYPMVFEALRIAQEQGFRWYDMAGTPVESEMETAEISKGAANRNQFKMAFDPVYQPLVPMVEVPLRQPMHSFLFGLRQKIKASRARKKIAGK